MKDQEKTKEELVRELAETRQRVCELEAIESRYKETEKALEFERKRLFSVLEAIPVWVYLQAPDYSIRWGNSKFLKLFGDPAGRPCYKAIQGRDKPCEPCPTFRVFETKELQEWEYTGDDGQTSIIYDNYFLDSDGSPLVLEMGVNITKQKQTEKELERHRARLRQINENLEELVEKRTSQLRELTGKLQAQNREIVALNEQLREENLRMEVEAKILAREMELARNIQTCLLPTLTEDVHPELDISATMLPSDQVGGDFYDVTLDRSGKLWLAIGDVSGHGVTPGLIMMMAQTVHTTVTSNLDCDARQVVVKINEILYKNVRERLNETHFMTFTALKHLGHGVFQHAGAHLSMIVFRRETGACELIRTKGVYLNFKKDISGATRNSEFSLDPGDILVLYTDGLTEAENSKGEMLDLDGFVEIVERHADREPEPMKNLIMADVLRWCDDERADDMTLVIVKRRGKSGIADSDDF